MSVGVPVTEWRRTSGNGELGTTSDNIVTLSGLQIVTLAGADLVILAGSYTPVPGTVWDVLEPTPVTEWRPTIGNDEFGSDGVSDIADPSGNLLVDTAGNQVVDTGVTDTALAATEWIEDDSV